jgi:endonuclease/exonuclease/phosphatase family metal-dependent hydrolase
MKARPPNTICIGLHNIQLLPENSRHYKSRQLIHHIMQAELDLLVMNEVGLNWKAVPASNQWAERTTGQLHGSKVVFAHNTTEPALTDTIQYGGVGIVVTKELAIQVISTGRDPTHLRRWVWIQIQGKKGHTVIIVTAY